MRSLRYSMSWIMNGGMDLPVPVSPEPPMRVIRMPISRKLTQSGGTDISIKRW